MKSLPIINNDLYMNKSIFEFELNLKLYTNNKAILRHNKNHKYNT